MCLAPRSIRNLRPHPRSRARRRHASPARQTPICQARLVCSGWAVRAHASVIRRDLAHHTLHITFCTETISNDDGQYCGAVGTRSSDGRATGSSAPFDGVKKRLRSEHPRTNAAPRDDMLWLVRCERRLSLKRRGEVMRGHNRGWAANSFYGM